MKLSRERRRVQTDCFEGGRTKESEKEKCDINLIVARHRSTGVIEHVNQQQPIYGDFTNVKDYHASLMRVRSAHEQFEALPATVRDHVGNDPGNFLEFVLDPKNREELEGLGLKELSDAMHGVLEEPKGEVDQADPPKAKEPEVTGGE